jgi:hypothetical protein
MVNGPDQTCFASKDFSLRCQDFYGVTQAPTSSERVASF